MKGDKYITSLEVAKLTGKRHENVINNIRGEIKKWDLDHGRDIFIEDTYVDPHGRTYPMYRISVKGIKILMFRYQTKGSVNTFKILRNLSKTL